MKKNSNDNDSVLIERVKNGDKGAFNFLVNKYYPRVYASLFSYTKSKEDSEDLAQQTFLKVWQQIESFRGDSAFFTWIYRIAINLAKNHFVSSGYKKQKVNTSIENAEIEISSYENIEAVLMHDQSMKQIKEFINNMPESLKTAFTLRESEGKSYEEISLITETPIGTVRSRIFRARESIIDYMQKELIGNE
ncbi:MAG: sigma-70 family RNA polymerase sigma factor [Gammaproteobacteria bacterium]|jgi:RNA polymerase sigma-70 factor (ECF subfamily)|tara:strand:+ start:5499 stop:6074 length:576 start_codon:yes stop_codon:yes gene_type:complete